MERRSKPRIEGPIPATLRYRDTLGNSVEVDTMLDNLSVGGCYVRLERQVEVAAHLHALIKFTGMKIEANGIVKRVEPKYDGSYGFGVAFENYRILSGR